MARTTTRPSIRAVPTVVRRTVRARLERSPGYRELDAEDRRRLAGDMTLIAAFADRRAGVDFPDFVAGLLKGVFDALVDGSQRQMAAYADLVAAVGRSVERFVADPTQRADLAGAMGDMFELCPDGTLALRGRCPKRPRRAAKRRPVSR